MACQRTPTHSKLKLTLERETRGAGPPSTSTSRRQSVEIKEKVAHFERPREENPKVKRQRTFTKEDEPEEVEAPKMDQRLVQAIDMCQEGRFLMEQSKNMKTEVRSGLSSLFKKLQRLIYEAGNDLAGKNIGASKTKKKDKSTETERIVEKKIVRKDKQTETEKEVKKIVEKKDKGTETEKNKDTTKVVPKKDQSTQMDKRQDITSTSTQENKEKTPTLEEKLLWKLEEHSRKLEENKKDIGMLREIIEKQNQLEEIPMLTYASVAAGPPPRRLPGESAALHSLMVTSDDTLETGEEVLQKLRKGIKATEGGVKIDRIRKAKDAKLIIGCKDIEDMKKAKERIDKIAGLNVVEARNKDPLVVLRWVFATLSDDEIINAIKQQNQEITHGLNETEAKMEIKYRKKTRNPNLTHVVVRTSPTIWRRLTEAGAVHVDIQRVLVADQSPLVQCSRCLEYGHTRRLCTETADICSHCGGPHLRSECPGWGVDTTPACKNCTRAKLMRADHNAFSMDCPIRRKWDAIARSTVAYN